MSQERPIRLALIGGGPDSFIGPVHCMAALLDRRFVLVAGAFSRDLGRSRERGLAWGVDAGRIHADHRELIAAEAKRTDGVEAIAIATPNHSHFAIASAALQAGLHVICDKPMTATLEQARELAAIANAAPGVFALTYTYAGYPMVREARERVAAGSIGRVRKVVVEYPQGWLAQPVEADNPQARWRTDPGQAGAGGCIGDIGVHALHLLEYVSGLRVEELCADLARVVPGRRLDDDCNVLLRLADGVPGVLTASQIATGERNGLRLRVYGERAALDWSHDAADALHVLHADGRRETIFAGAAAAGGAARGATRLPAGHPEGFIEAFANLYRDFADAIGGRQELSGSLLPGASDGLRSLRFIETAVASHAARTWLSFEGETL